MKAYKVTLVFVDHDGLGPEETRAVLESTGYPNHCMSPEVLDIREVDIGEWHDNHPLNFSDPEMEEWKRLFHTPDPEVATIPEIKRPVRGQMTALYHEIVDADDRLVSFISNGEGSKNICDFLVRVINREGCIHE